MDKQYELIAFTAFMEHIRQELAYAMDHHWPKEIIEEAGFDETGIKEILTDIDFKMSDAILALKDVRYHMT